ncbi:homeobox protein, partial [Trema orientale]
MIEAMKKLKLWPRKKREKKTHHPLLYYPPPPTRPPPPPPPPTPPPLPPSHHWCCSCSKAGPSAPPLTSADDCLFVAGVQPAASDFDYPALADDESSSSYQQYMVPNPVYGIPVSVPMQAAQRERCGGVFGCVINF